MGNVTASPSAPIGKARSADSVKYACGAPNRANYADILSTFTRIPGFFFNVSVRYSP